jgi:phosphate:Na+ symporter
MALKLARAEVVRMGQLVQRMVEVAVLPFLEHRPMVTRQLAIMENEVDFLRERIDQYLSRIGQRKIVAGDVEEAFQLMYATAELEQIADIVSTIISPRAANWLVAHWRFSSAGDAELRAMHARALKQIARSVTLLRERRPEQAERMRKKYKKYRTMEMDYMRAHFERMRSAVPETLATTEVHQELMEQLMRIASHATNVARIMLTEHPAPDDGQAPPRDVPPPPAGQAQPPGAAPSPEGEPAAPGTSQKGDGDGSP